MMIDVYRGSSSENSGAFEMLRMVSTLDICMFVKIWKPKDLESMETRLVDFQHHGGGSCDSHILCASNNWGVMGMGDIESST